MVYFILFFQIRMCFHPILLKQWKQFYYYKFQIKTALNKSTGFLSNAAIKNYSVLIRLQCGKNAVVVQMTMELTRKVRVLF